MFALARCWVLVAIAPLIGSAALAQSVAATRPQVRELYIARHGQTEWNRLGRVQGDPDLDPLGYEHRVGLYLLLRNVELDAIYTSAMQRTRRTAELVARERGLQPQAEADLNEMEGGVFEGVCHSTTANEEMPDEATGCRPGGLAAATDPVVTYLRSERAKRHMDKPGYRPPGGESYADGAHKVAGFLARERQILSERRVLVVGHSGTNRLMLAHIMGWPMRDVVRITIHNDWVFRVRDDGGGPRLTVFRDGAWRECNGVPDERAGLACTSEQE